jgi:ABC-type uncharacterized transport system ATPase subunit
VCAAGTLDALRASWPTRVVEVEPATPALRAVLDEVPGAHPLPATSGATLAYELPASTDAAALLRALVAVGPVTRFARLEPRLHDVYLRAIGAAA